MAITYFPDDVTILGGDLVLGNTGPSPASGTPVSGKLTLQPAGNTTAGELYFQAKTGAGTLRTTTFKNSTSSAADQTYTLPVNYPGSNGYVLASTTAGVLSWAASGGGSGTVGGTGTAKRLTRWAAGGADIEDTAWDATGDVLTYDDSTQKVIIDPVPGTITIQQPDGGSTYLLLGAEYSDTQARFELTNAAIQWGPGGGTARDVTLTRTSANNLTLGGGDTFNADHIFIDNAGDIKLSDNGTIDTSTAAGDLFQLRAYATTGGTRVALITLTNAALAPTLDFPTGATWNGQYIYHAGGTDVPVADGGTGSSTAAAALVALGAGPQYSSIMMPPIPKINNTQASSSVSDSKYAIYLGKCPKACTSFIVRVRLTTNFATGGAGPWAEVGIASGSLVAGTDPVLTILGTTDVAATYTGGTGNKQTTITATAAAGDDLWFIHGSKGTTPYALRGLIADELGSGIMAVYTTAGAISGIGAGTTFTISTSASAAAVVCFPQ